MPVLAGQLRDRLTFEARSVIDDGYGNEVSGPWAAQFTVAARVTTSPGRETVTAQRLAGVNPVDVWVRWSEQTKNIRTEWRAVDARDPERVFAILSVTDPEEYRRQFRLLSCTLGGVS
ncbi:head-tail adaptor protein [Microvirga mediterraneensis]|uniref:Head-tail adaptor protein n=1 Tax=Microvirga mediterraneensis TaxID=2754695 RepID=A0A838BPU2_9HYPH|nr:head-tail adaptor protein [Microvirga mediterraneensis]MBA1157764.1 head-tail adaptor protein [Microvirga mediterraneensis]